MQVEDNNSSKDVDLAQKLDPAVKLAKVDDKSAPKPKYFPWSFVKIGGVLAVLGGVVFLPTLLNPMSCVSKAKNAEAKYNIQSINRTQEANFLEKNTFTHSVTNLDIGIKSQTVNYIYSIQTTKTASFHYALARKPDLKSYVGAVFVLPSTTDKSELKTANIICELLPPATIPTAPSLVKGIPTCGAGTN
jgi:type IV pilus assembly protein PilA